MGATGRLFLVARLAARSSGQTQREWVLRTANAHSSGATSLLFVHPTLHWPRLLCSGLLSLWRRWSRLWLSQISTARNYYLLQSAFAPNRNHSKFSRRLFRTTRSTVSFFALKSKRQKALAANR